MGFIEKKYKISLSPDFLVFTCVFECKQLFYNGLIL